MGYGFLAYTRQLHLYSFVIRRVGIQRNGRTPKLF